MRQKIAILYIGGSIGMMMNQKTGRIDAMESIGEIHRFIPDIQKEVHIEFFPIANVGSSDVTPEHWILIARTIEKHYNAFDGFIVIHGTNTIAYTASALSFALQGLSKPVIFTGSILPINDVLSDARRNLIFAIRAAQLDIAEVCIVMGAQVLRGTRSKKVRESIDGTFNSTRFPALANFTNEYTLHPWRHVRRKRTLECSPHFDPNVTLLTLHPGLPMKFLDAVTNSGLHGIVMRSYGPGMIPEQLIPWIQKLTDMEIPIVMTSQVLDSLVDMHRYRKQLIFEHLGIISGKDMTYECAIAKLMWVLAKTRKLEKVQKLMEKSLVGEVSE